VRTFKPRRRALSERRQAMLAEFGPRYLLDDAGDPLDLAAVFGRTAPVVIEIGIGGGEALVTTMSAEADVDHIGIDVHTPGVAGVIATAAEAGIENVRLVHGDALVFLDRLAPGTIAGIRLFFPDPWPKNRQRHRRIVNATNVARFVGVLKQGAYLHIVTDVVAYAAAIAAVCAAEPRLAGGEIARPTSRPETRHERKGRTAGRRITDLWYTRRP